MLGKLIKQGVRVYLVRQCPKPPKNDIKALGFKKIERMKLICIQDEKVRMGKHGAVLAKTIKHIAWCIVDESSARIEVVLQLNTSTGTANKYCTSTYGLSITYLFICLILI